MFVDWISVKRHKNSESTGSKSPDIFFEALAIGKLLNFEP